MTDSKFLRAIHLLTSCIDPRAYSHALRRIHYWNYSHVKERRKLKIGGGTRISPTTSFRNAERIKIGSLCFLGENCYFWAGDSTGRIVLGDRVSVAPGVFLTASDYSFVKGLPFRDQPKRETDVVIGSDVWLGTGVIVTAGVKIGDGCIVGAGAVVTRDLGVDAIAVGVPAKVVGTR